LMIELLIKRCDIALFVNLISNSSAA